MWPLQTRGAGIIADSKDTRGAHRDSCGWEVDSGNTQQGEVAVVAQHLADRLGAIGIGSQDVQREETTL